MAKILIVDDSLTMLTGISKILVDDGHDVITAANGAKGIEKSLTESPEIILMDVVMPDMDGFQATLAITTNPATQHIPVIMLTTKDQQTDKTWATQQGASEYIVKPPNPEELLAKIDYLLYG